MSIRALEAQFEPETVRDIRAIIDRAEKLHHEVPGGATRFYLYELGICLEAGALLAALHIASMSLELFLRAKITEAVHEAITGRARNLGDLSYQQQLEERKKLKIIDLLNALAAAGLFNPEDIRFAKQFHEDVRTPLAHGLLDRLEYGRPLGSDTTLGSLLGHIGGFTSMSQIEDFLERDVVSHIETVTGILERSVMYRGETA